MLKNRHDKKVISATALSLGLFLLAASALSLWLRAPKRIESDSASSLVQMSFQNEEIGQLKRQAQHLGSYVSTEAMAAQCQRLSSQMQKQGATAETANAVLEKAASWENFFKGGRRNVDDVLWPLTVKAALVNNQEAWVVLSGRWYPEKPSRTGLCGTVSPYEQLAHRICVVENKAPYRCWVTSFHYEFSTPQERKNYILDKP